MIYLACIFYAVTDVFMFVFIGPIGIPFALLIGAVTIWVIDSGKPRATRVAVILFCLVVFCAYPLVLLVLLSPNSRFLMSIGPQELGFFAFRAAVYLAPTIVLKRLLRGTRPTDA